MNRPSKPMRQMASELGRPSDLCRRCVMILWAQGIYYLLTGAWPIMSIRTFQWVTGPKTDHMRTGRESDHWLVITVGVLVTAVGLALLVGAWRRRPSVELAVLAIGCALGLSVVDIIYVARNVIDPIYLLDAIAELVLIGGWAAVIAQKRLRGETAAV